LTVSSGDLSITGKALVSFVETNVFVNGGAMRFTGSSEISVDSSTFDVFIGSVNFLGSTIVTFEDAAVNIIEGDLQFGENSSVSFLRSPIKLEGQLEFLGDAKTHFQDSDVSIVNGNFHAKDNCAVFFDHCILDVAGTLHAQNEADIRIEDSRVTINNGDFRVNDQGSFAVHRSSLQILSGNFIAHNPNPVVRKYMSFSNSVVTVERTSNNVLNGHMEVRENVEITFVSSDVQIDGDLVLTGSSRLNVFEESSFVIPSGVVEMAQSSSIIIDGSSSLLNQGQLVAPGSLRVPGDSSMSNEGLLEAEHDFNANCFDDMSNGAPLSNSGTFRMGISSSVQSCVDNLQHSGLMQLGGANVTFNQIQTTSGSTITLSGSRVSVSSQDSFQSEGNLGGSGLFSGSFVNSGDAVIMANGEEGTTKLDVEGDFTSSGTMFFSINSRDLSDPGALTQVNAGQRVQFEGGRACVCFNPSLQLEEGDRFDLVIAQTTLNGRFDQVEFDCVECPRRNAKSIEGTNAECDPSTDYGGASFSVLLDACSGEGDYFDSISPPFYVIVPVSVGIIIIIVVVFGGSLVVEQHYRKKKFQKKVAAKRRTRVKNMVQQNQRSVSSASGSMSTF